MEFEGDAEPDMTAATRGIFEGEIVRVTGSSYRDTMGKIGTLEIFATATVIVDEKRYIIGAQGPGAG